jgi:hypothetical protein
MTRKAFLCLFSVLSAIFASGCGGADGDIYVSGYTSTVGSNTTPAYWKNGIQTNLPQASTGTSAFVNATFLNGTDVYAAGSDADTPCYWVNGQKVSLSPGYGVATGVNGGDGKVYISGYIYSSAFGTMFAVYWQVSLTEVVTREILSTETQGLAFANAIYYRNGHVYVAGDVNNPSSSDVGTPAYWVDNSAGYTGFPEVKGTFHSIYVDSNGSIYVAGEETDSNGDNPSAVYYKDGVRNVLYQWVGNEKYGVAKSIFVNGTDVYVAGYYHDYSFSSTSYGIAAYWKNGVKTDLITPAESTDSKANSLIIKNNNVYICGSYYDSSGRSIAAYWNNGQKTDLTFTDAPTAEAYGIFIP